MEVVYEETRLRAWMLEAAHVSPDHPVLIDKFLEDALEIDVDAVADKDIVVIGGVMEHIEKAGVHSGDAACALPPYSLDEVQVRTCAPRPRPWRRPWV
jgi:carbamoyl-phosphate synthase large subunit